jgi:hypothetical protein
MTPCKVEGCQRPAAPRRAGFCSPHYMRSWRHGSPTAGQTSPGTLPAFISRALEWQSNDCLLWPYGKRHGYGAISVNGVQTGAHTVVCEVAHGPKPSPRHEVAHACGARACINPRHLRWDTSKGNHADTLTHGTRRLGDRVHSAKLTAADVIAIRSQLTRSQHDLAREYGVKQSSIWKILNRRNWKHIP